LKQPPVRHHVSLIVDRVEAVVLGTKQTIPFWRAKRPLLVLERALAPLRQIRGGVVVVAAPALAHARDRSRITAEAKRKGRFSET
jgi:hypothetical protein